MSDIIEVDSSEENRGAGLTLRVGRANFPNADEIVRQGLLGAPGTENAVDMLLVNPPAPADFTAL